MNYPTQTDIASEATTYNGWKNYATWNVSLWIQNDEIFYDDARRSRTYAEFVECVESYGSTITPDEVSWNDPALDVLRLDEVITSIY
jgi:hypothetical protein